jgi:hypothetical protein
MAGKKWLQEEYGGIVRKLPIYAGRNKPSTVFT